ncbi:ATP-binding SpoIIE family protein phosphatase [Pinibacter soli]|uniref:ATP-binding protein/SpoIIE family protein phosphatase n=1 Tax=Pinibacter soli TaxID=3044211 RepID=A0ABT6RE65_9BACT|nr:ATP-binding SpoIIE family protein phosphatase [Pinibacter soli]MDI3320691.1 ATP-binding protein/SpoIIE family protein phosphatase [Pinibacter soli]
MANEIHISFNASDRSYFSILKKEIHHIAVGLHFSQKKIGEIDIIVAEITSNLAKHAGGGEILVRAITDPDEEGLEIIGIDNGPGMTDPLKMISDGMSTANTLGHGLGAIKRLSDDFEIFSLKDWGTVLLSRVFKKSSTAQRKSKTEIKSIVVAKPGETVSGDATYHKVTKDYITLFIGDGLGHGVEANKAVMHAVETVAKIPFMQSPSEMLRQIHIETKRTRGLVGTVAIYSIKQKTWSICGIGNIATRSTNGFTGKNYLSYNGIIGHNIPNTLKEQITDAEHSQTIIMCSDGIKTRWDLQKYPGILKCDLSILAAVIYKDHARKTDDMSVIVGRVNGKL